MTLNSSATAAKTPARRASARRTASRLTRFQGGEQSAALVEEAMEASPEGITAGLASIVAADGQQIIQAPTGSTVPHPFNPPTRSQPHPESSQWTELVDSVRASGVQVPILLVSREAFLAARPGLESEIGSEARYVIIYGHRRRAAAVEAGVATVPAVVDDSVMDDDGDLDAMTIENLHRKGLSDLEQAEIFAYYSEAGLNQRAIADRLGFHQSTVSRKLSLLLMAPEVLAAVQAGKIKTEEASTLVGKLPFGPLRRWQQDAPGFVPDPDQDTDQRRSDQMAACELVVRGMSPSRAADRVLAERRSRARAAKEGIEVVDAAARFGPQHQQHAVSSPADVQGEVVAAIDELQGGLVYYPADAAPAAAAEARPDASAAVKAENKLRTAAMKARRAACGRLVASPPPREKLLPLLVAQYSTGVAALAAGSAGWSLAYEFSRAAGLAGAEYADLDSYRAAAATESELKRQLEIAWACAVAGFELHASDKARGSWSDSDVAYLQLLQDRANYVPTGWERDRLAAHLNEK
ncbi:ParB/RepB/Spo0J family partition protein [Mycobacteroides abscessus subsp. massiliense]|nr:ParB/RepB/Spo0J family partition protein [Mycobacteroides abscessus subsp. massiliense]